jgi:HSP20 family molecular chaperone IbpA
MEHGPEVKNLLSIETPYGQSRRSFLLPKGILYDQIEAAYKGGVLKIRISKRKKN